MNYSGFRHVALDIGTKSLDDEMLNWSFSIALTFSLSFPIPGA